MPFFNFGKKKGLIKKPELKRLSKGPMPPIVIKDEEDWKSLFSKDNGSEIKE